MGLQPDKAVTGTRVRVIGATDRQGAIRRPPTQTDGEWSVRVAFDDGSVRLNRLEQLELIPEILDAITEVGHGNFQGPDSLRRNLLHEKLHGRMSDMMYSMDTSDTQFYAYQFKPILKLLESPTNSLLVADEVGLGKTIEAGLIWTELKAREGSRTLLVICPPHLATKWVRELKRRFGVDARKANAADIHEKLKEARTNRSAGFALVGTYHGLRPPKNWVQEGEGEVAQLARNLAEWGNTDEPFLDLLVMDEAAIMRNESSQTSELGALLAPIAKHKVYLSATPIHTKARNLFVLLKRLDPDTFSDERTFADILSANEPLVALRDAILLGVESREMLLKKTKLAMESPMLHGNNSLMELNESLQKDLNLADPKIRAHLAYQTERVNLLSYLVTRTRRRDVDTDPVLREVKTVKVALKVCEEKVYHQVTEAVHEYTEEQGIGSGFLTVMPQRQVASCVYAAYQRFSDNKEADDEINPDLTWDRGSQKVGPLVNHLRDRLVGKANARELYLCDSKYQKLREALTAHWQEHPENKVVLFAYFKPTLYYLRDRLKEDGFDSLLLTGDEVVDKQSIVDKFATSSNVSIMLSSEVGSEGLDLQFASVLINYDLPWNPMVVEQRIGRIHRIGQKAKRIAVMNLICEGTVDERIYDRLYNRLDLFRKTLGDLEAVIGPLINDLTKELLSLRLSPQNQAERIEQTALAIESNIQYEHQLEQQASVLAAYGDYIINQITAAHNRRAWINEDDLESYVLQFFKRVFPATKFFGISDKTYEVEMDVVSIIEFDGYLSIKNLRGETGLATQEKRTIRFDHRTFTGSGARVEHIHQSHPLVKFIGQYSRQKDLVKPVATIADLPLKLAPSQLERGIYAFVSQRWTVEGIRMSERLHHQVLNLDSDSRLNDQSVAASLIEIAAALGNEYSGNMYDDQELKSRLKGKISDLEFDADQMFHEFLKQARLENEDRKKIQLNGILNFEKRREASLLQARIRLLDGGHKALVAANRGQIDKLKKKCEIQREKIIRQQTSGECVTIAAGLVLIR